MPWFHPFCSPTDSNILLKSQPVGTFLVRFASEKNTCFGLDYVATKGVVETLLISTRPSGIYVRTPPGTESREYLKFLTKSRIRIYRSNGIFAGNPKLFPSGEEQQFPAVADFVDSFSPIFDKPFVSDCVGKP